MQDGIIIHCSDSPQGRGDDVTDIDRWHKERGWSGVGYHFVVLEDGTIQIGRDINKSGAHAKGYNDYVGICLIGIDSFTDKQYFSLQLLVNGLMNQYDIEPSKVLGHYRVSSKTCPNIDIEDFKERYKLN